MNKARCERSVGIVERKIGSLSSRKGSNNRMAPFLARIYITAVPDFELDLEFFSTLQLFNCLHSVSFALFGGGRCSGFFFSWDFGQIIFNSSPTSSSSISILANQRHAFCPEEIEYGVRPQGQRIDLSNQSQQYGHE